MTPKYRIVERTTTKLGPVGMCKSSTYQIQKRKFGFFWVDNTPYDYPENCYSPQDNYSSLQDAKERYNRLVLKETKEEKVVHPLEDDTKTDKLTPLQNAIGLGFWIVFMTLIVLKTTGIVAWSWWAITAPLWIPTCAVVVLILFMTWGN